MTRVDFIALSPLLVVAYGGVIVMLIAASRRARSLVMPCTLLTLAAAIAAVVLALPYSPRTVTTLVEIDLFSLYFMGLIVAASLLVTLLCPQYARVHSKRPEALYVLILFATLGMMAIAASNHFVSFFLGLEILSVSLYGLIGYTRSYKRSIEGAIKYLILAATASAFLLFGIALIYAQYGTMSFTTLAARMSGALLPPTVLFGLALVIVGIGFKLALVPFHMWSPDVYQGAPAPITALIATGSKGAVFALLLRLVAMTDLISNGQMYLALTVLAIATMSVGNLLALLQTDVKRLLAYSSVAHMGYLLIPLLAAEPAGASSIAFYLAAYIPTTIIAFGVISVLALSRADGQLGETSEYRGLALRSPVLAALMTLALLSLTGIPLTAGFIAKFFIFSAAAQSELWTLLIVGVVNAGLAAFYYLRVIVAMFSPVGAELGPVQRPSAMVSVSLVNSSAVVLFFGVYPTPLIRLAEAAVAALAR